MLHTICAFASLFGIIMFMGVIGVIGMLAKGLYQQMATDVLWMIE